MKKFYSLLAAAALSVGMLSAQNFAQVRTLDNQAVASNKSALATKSLKAVAPKADLPNVDLAGEYMTVTTMNDNKIGAACQIVKGQGENQYLIKGFIFSDANDIPATYQMYQIGDKAYAALVIAGDNQVTFFSDSGVDYKLRLFGYDGTQPTVYPDDIPFLLLEDGSLLFPFEDMGLAWLNPDMRGNWVIEPGMFKPNATFTGQEYLDNTNTEAASYPLYIETTSRLGAEWRYVYGIGGTIYPLNLKVNGNQATATDALGGEARVDQTTTAEFYFCNVEDTSAYKVEATVNGDNISFGTLMIINFDYGWLAKWDNAVINGGAAINDVTADVIDENAPVEYFNLQGVRVNNPEGGLSIMRQGNKVTKVIR